MADWVRVFHGLKCSVDDPVVTGLNHGRVRETQGAKSLSLG